MLLGDRYCASDGFRVRVTSEASCRSTERLPRGREVDRARFYAWPYAHAKRAQTSASTLRSDSKVALVLDGVPTTDPEESAALALLERREALLRLERPEGTVDEGETDLPWMPSERGEVLVVPTLDVVASSAR